MTFDVAYSPDGSKLAVSNASGVDIWNTSTWEPEELINAYSTGSPLHDYLEGRFNPSSEPDGAVAWSGDGSKICFPTQEGILNIYNPSTGAVLATMDGQDDVIRAVAFSSDGTRVASGSFPSTASNAVLDPVAKVWNASTGALVKSRDGHSDGVASVSLNSDGSKCASVDKGNKVRVWNVSDGSVIEDISYSGVMACAFSPDNSMLAIGGSGIKIIDTSDWSTLHTLSHSDVWDLDWTSNSGTLASAGGTTVKTWNASTGANLKSYNSINYTPAGDQDMGLNGVAIAPNGSQVACCGAANAVEVWDTSTDEKLVEMDNHVGIIRSGDVSPDETKIAVGTFSSGDYDPDIVIFSVSTGEVLATCSGHTEQISCVDWSPDGTKLVSTSRDATVRIWNASTGALIRTINASASYTRHCEWSPDSTKIVSSSQYAGDKYQGYVEVWNASNGDNIRSWYEDGEFYWCCWSPDGTEVAGGGREDKIYTWNVSSGSKTGTFTGHGADVYSCDWSNDGYEIASSSADNEIKIWDVSSEECVLTKGGTVDVRCVAWSPDDTMVGSTRANSSIRIIDSSNGDVLRLSYENGCGTNALVWLDNDKFATFGDDGTARIFGTAGPQPPGKASNPSPANEATDVSTTADLSWTAGSGADSHDVYFGTTSPGDSKGNQAETTYDPGTMTDDTTYYWRIDEVNTQGTTTGDVWSFTTILEAPPSKATNPSPANSATGVSVAADLSWTAGSGATSHDVYFGTTSPGDSKGNQTETTYDPGTMSYDTTYYWRIDEKNAYGTTTGDVWSFTTQEESDNWTVYECSQLPGDATPSWYEQSSTELDDEAVLLSVIDDPCHSGNKLIKVDEMAGNYKEAWAYDWGMSPSTGATIVSRVKAFDTGADRYFEISFRDGVYQERMEAYANTLNMVYGGSSASVDTDDWHLYRITLQGTNIKVYQDEDTTPVLTDTFTNTDTSNFLRFGDTRTSETMASLYDWIIWDTTGAFAPGEGSPIPSYLIGAGPQPPSKATNPSPANSATDVSITADLSWTAGSGATSRDVYFGTTSPGDSKGNQTETTYDPGTMANDTTYYWRIDEKNTAGTTTGVVWSFTTEAPPPPPGQATNPSPSDEATDVSTTADLSWTAGSGATSRDVYFGTTSPGDSKGNQTETTYDPGTMDNDTTYYWRIDEKNAGGTTEGVVWSFTTAQVPAPGKATNPSPTNSATSVSITADLSWTAGSGATSRDVYFGTTSPGDSKGNQTETTYDTGTMSYETTYYWRIDEKNAGGTTTGDVWSFTTQAEPSGVEYTEARDKWEASSSETWETKDLSGYGVPANAVVEVTLKNGSSDDQRYGGVRAVGSGLDRKLELHEAEGGGDDLMTMHVQTNGSSQIQTYTESTGSVKFVLIGWWSSGAYVEKMSEAFKAGSSGSWVDKDLSSYGVPDNAVVEICLKNEPSDHERWAGVRANGSSLDRRVELHEAEGGGDDFATMFVQADGSGGVEVYAEDDSDVDFYVLGYWSTTPGTYTEKFVDVGKPSSDNTWQDRDLSGNSVPANAVCEMLMCNGKSDSENNMGVRENGSTISDRYFDVHESEGGGRDCIRMHVTADGDSTIEQYMEDVSDTAEFYLLGYWQ